MSTKSASATIPIAVPSVLSNTNMAKDTPKHQNIDIMNKVLLIADSGSTKTDWVLVSESGNPQYLSTQGINPFHQASTVISTILREELLPQIPDPGRVGCIRFYGSGVRPELEPLMKQLLADVFREATDVEAHGDLLGAARALCGNREGIACILGTGANSCLYDGRAIVMNTPPLGYILGDEGSGAVMGRRLLNAVYKRQLDANLQVELCAWTGMDMPQVINRVYREPMANRWLASLSVFVRQHLDNPDVERLVIDNFRDFIRLNVNPYKRRDLPLNAVGSIAHFFIGQLRQAAEAEGYTLGHVMRSPLEGLLSVDRIITWEE